MPARSVCLVALSLSEAGPGRFGRQVSVIDIYHTIPDPFKPAPMRYPAHVQRDGLSFGLAVVVFSHGPMRS